jgi:PAS domain S-box-containing protein
MSSPEPRLKQDHELQPSDGAGVVRPFGSESKHGGNTTTPTQAESLLAAEKRILEMMANGASLSEVLNDLCTAIDAHAPPTISMVCLMDPDGKQLLPGAGPHLPPAFTAAITPWPIGANRGSCGTAAFTKQRVIIPDISNDPRWPDEARALALSHGFCAAWSEPLISKDGEVLGTFCLSYAEPRIPNSRDLEFIQAAAHIALIAIELERSRLALKNAVVEIRNSENKLRTIIDTIPGFVCTLSAAGEVELVNRQILEYFGKTMEELKNWATSNVVHPDDLPRAVDAWKHSIETGQPYDLELRQRRADGVYRWFQSRALPTRDTEGRIIGWHMLLTDIDDRKRAEDALRLNEQDLRLIVDSIPGFVSTANAAGEIELVNRQVLEYFGMTIEELKNWTTSDNIHPDDLHSMVDAWRRAIETGQPFDFEQRSRGPDGVWRWFHDRSLPQRDAEGRVIRWYNLSTDIDDRKRAEAELEKAFEEIKRLKDRLHDENVVLREQIDQAFMFEEIVGSSPALKTVLSSIVKVAPTDSTVLITGETGTGKELIARAIHKGSQRAGQAFVSVNCSAIPSSLIASELFGHEKGAFTGALQRHQGRFELAHSGTIFLDEIGELPAETQIALLRVLQERQFERVGSSRVIHTDVRIIAATNRDLSAAIAAGAFRTDLFYRLNVFPIRVPPLRERKEDIPMLVEYFVRRYAEKAGKQISKIDKNTLKLCQSYPWPGNIRELQNIVERSVILCAGDTFWIDDAWLSSQDAARKKWPAPLSQSLHNYEKELIEAALAESKGKVAGPDGAAVRLGIPRSTLDLKIKQLNIKKNTIR